MSQPFLTTADAPIPSSAYDLRLYCRVLGIEPSSAGIVPPIGWVGHNESWGDSDEEDLGPDIGPVAPPPHYIEREGLPILARLHINRFRVTPEQRRGRVQRRATHQRQPSSTSSWSRARQQRPPSGPRAQRAPDPDFSLFFREGWRHENSSSAAQFFNGPVISRIDAPGEMVQEVKNQHGQILSLRRMRIADGPPRGWVARPEYREENYELNGGWMALPPAPFDKRFEGRERRMRWLPRGESAMSPRQSGATGVQHGTYEMAPSRDIQPLGPILHGIGNLSGAATAFMPRVAEREQEMGRNRLALAPPAEEPVVPFPTVHLPRPNMAVSMPEDKIKPGEEDKDSKGADTAASSASAPPAGPLAWRQGSRSPHGDRMPGGSFWSSYGPMDRGHIAHKASSWRNEREEE